MAGHSKWAQIKRHKEAEDAKKSRLFSTLVQTITIEARRSGGDRNAPGLRKAIEKAKAANMPAVNIERAINHALAGGGEELDEVLYEAYGPGGAALIIDGVTNNKNRTSQEIKRILSGHGTTLAAPGSVTWAFEKTPAGGWQAKNPISLSEDGQKELGDLINELHEHAEIKNVFTNTVCG